MKTRTSGRAVIVDDKEIRFYGCAKWRCDQVNTEWTAFGARRHNYCLGHIPWYTRVSMRLRGVV